jgi:hypothetical protein
MKYFLITIDTEGDNLWEWNRKDKIQTENTLYLSRFQQICDEYGFKPVWLTNYEMISDPRYVDFISNVEERNTGEIGMHLHAWNSPPDYMLQRGQEGKPYLIEYPDDIIEEKIAHITELIKSRTGISPVSHRAGRWATNERYFHYLMEYQYKVDCSVTPHIDWRTMPGMTKGFYGSNYINMPDKTFYIQDNNSKKKQSILEVPVTIRDVHRFIMPDFLSLKKMAGSLYRMVKGQTIWLRPNGKNNNKMKYIVQQSVKSEDEYIMFMLHSSELMPGGSPLFRTIEDIDKLYHDMEELFKYIARNFTGITLRDFEKISHDFTDTTLSLGEFSELY